MLGVIRQLLCMKARIVSLFIISTPREGDKKAHWMTIVIESL